MSSGAYNSFILELSKPHPHAIPIVQKETKADKQHKNKNVQEPPGHVSPRKGKKLVHGRHGGCSKADEAAKRGWLCRDQTVVEFRLWMNESIKFPSMSTPQTSPLHTLSFRNCLALASYCSNQQYDESGRVLHRPNARMAAPCRPSFTSSNNRKWSITNTHGEFRDNEARGRTEFCLSYV